MAKDKKVIISVCLCGSVTRKEQAPTVPYTPEELSDQVVECAKAGASIAHIHVREDKEVNGTLWTGQPSMSLDLFEKTVALCREKCRVNDVDIILNLATSGGESDDTKRLLHLQKLHPEMCSFNTSTLNWNEGYVAENNPRFLNQLAQTVVKENIKPEFDLFDVGQLHFIEYYCNRWNIPSPRHYQLLMGIKGAMPGDTTGLASLVSRLPANSTWSVSGIGKSHMEMMLAGLALGCDGLRVGLEDNIIFGLDETGAKIIATNKMLVTRAVALSQLAGRKVASAQDARNILGVTRNCLKDSST